MHILLASYYYPPSIGGLERQSHLLARGLAARGNLVEVISARLEGFASSEMLDGVQVTRVAPGTGSRWRKMATYIAGMCVETVRRRHVDVIQVQQALYPAAAMTMVARALGRPLVVRNSGSEQFGAVEVLSHLPLGRTTLKLIANGAACVSLTDQMTAEMRQARFRRIVQIPNGVELPDATTAEARELARARLRLNEQPAVLFLGRLAEEKGLDLLLAAWRRAAPSATLLLVGDGPERPNLKRILAADPALGRSVRLCGDTRDPYAYFAAADLFVAPSRSEGISNSLLEAMSCGLPVVVSDVGGNRQVISRPELGRLVPPGDIEALAAALTSAMANQADRRRMGEAGRAHVRASYSLDAMLDAYERLYSTLGRRRDC